jgi:hypothetical protein
MIVIADAKFDEDQAVTRIVEDTIQTQTDPRG